MRCDLHIQHNMNDEKGEMLLINSFMCVYVAYMKYSIYTAVVNMKTFCSSFHGRMNLSFKIDNWFDDMNEMKAY